MSKTPELIALTKLLNDKSMTDDEKARIQAEISGITAKADLKDFVEYCEMAMSDHHNLHIGYEDTKDFILEAMRVWYDGHEDREQSTLGD